MTHPIKALVMMEDLERIQFFEIDEVKI